MSFSLRVPLFRLLALIFITTIAGCSAMLVPATGDPAKKLRYAYILFDEQLRPLPAEQLITEAIEIYFASGDDRGLGESYRAYGFFLRSPAVKRWEGYYLENGFLEPDTTFSNRFEMSARYFEKSASRFLASGTTEILANVWLNQAFSLEFAGRMEEACEAYDKSRDAAAVHLEQHSGEVIETPEGYENFDAYIEAIEIRLGCT